VGLHIASAGEDEALSQIDQGLADIAIVSAITEPRTSHLVLPLYRWEMIGLAAAGHRLSREKRPLRLEDLNDVPLMTYDSARAADSAYARAFAQQGLAAAPLVATARDSELIKSLVRSGAGVGLLAEMAWTADDADLARLKIGHLFGRYTAWAVLPRDRIVRRHVLEFVTAIAPHLDRDLLRAAAADSRAAAWPTAPLWRELQSASSARHPDPRLALSQPPLRLVAQA
jgi:LysR family cys regulon transcriptional activator